MPLRKDVIWDCNQQTEGGVKSSHAGTIIFPSGVGQNAPSPECKTRTEIPKVGQIESCVLYKIPTSDAYLAYPAAKNYQLLDMPGYHEPVPIIWQENLRIPGQVITTFTLPRVETYFRVFPHDRWGYMPQPNEVTICRIFWHHNKSGLDFGYAYEELNPGQTKIHVHLSDNTATIGGTGVAVTTSQQSYDVSASRDERGVITLVLEPIS